MNRRLVDIFDIIIIYNAITTYDAFRRQCKEKNKFFSISIFETLIIWDLLLIILFKVKCTTGRTSIGGCLPLKIENKFFYYLIDKQGTFVNPKLFDYATG